MLDRGSGTIVNVTSGAAYHDPPAPAGEGGWGLGYSISKGAMHRIAGVLSLELRDQGINVFNKFINQDNVSGYKVPPNYDSLMAKLLVHQPTRPEALACMRRALAEFVVEGVKTTVPIHREIFNHSAFIEGRVDTTFIERNWMKG